MVAVAPPPTSSAVKSPLQSMIENAKRDAVDHLVDARFERTFATFIPQLQETVRSESAKQLGKLQTAALSVAEALGRTEKELDAKRNVLDAEFLAKQSAIEAALLESLRGQAVDLAKSAIADMLPRPVALIDANGLELGRTTSRVRPEFDAIVKRLMCGLNVLLVGPAGCGKSHLGEQIAEFFSVPFACVSFSAGVSESRLVGRFAPMGDGGKFEYVETDIVRVWRDGGVIVLDEIDAADPNVLLCMNAALANGWLITPNPAAPRIKRHPKTMVIACANTWGQGADRQYVGRSQLDASTLDRFVASQFALDYDEQFEREAGESSVVSYFHDVRRQTRENKIRRVVSTRIILDGSKLVRAGVPLDEVKESFFLPWTEAERNAVGYCR